MSTECETLSEVISKIGENELIYIGTKSGSGFFFIGTKSEIGDDIKACFNRTVVTTYHRTTCPDEYGTVIIIKGSAVSGGFWFQDEYLAANNMLRPFNPVNEIKHQRYELGDQENYGRFKRLYHEIRIDYFGNKFALATFNNNDIKHIRQNHLPGGCFIMTEQQLSEWLQRKIGEKWTKKPKEILRYFGLELYGDALDGRIMHEGKVVFIATDTVEMDGVRKVLQVDEEAASFKRSPISQCSFVPIFFSRAFKNAVFDQRI